MWLIPRGRSAAAAVLLISFRVVLGFCLSCPGRIAAADDLDWKVRDELGQLLRDPYSQVARDALKRVRQEAVRTGNGRTWFETLRMETFALLDRAGAKPADLDEAAARLQAADPFPGPALEVARQLLLADLYDGASRRFVSTPSVPESARLAHLDAARKAYDAAFSRRKDLGGLPRSALVFPSSPIPAHETARDVVTHLYAKALESQPLPVGETLAAAPLLGSMPPDALASPSPLARACALLDDLERWHATEGRPDKALAARLERLWTIFGTMPPEEQQVVVEDLRRLLPAYRSTPGWSMGMAQLALFVNELSPAPDEALRLAEEGAAAESGSAGGKRCATIAKILRLELDDPEVAITPLRSAVPGEELFVVRHRRAATLQFRAVPFPVQDILDNCLAPFFPPRDAGRFAELDSGSAIVWESSLPSPEPGKFMTTRLRAPLTLKGLYRVDVSLQPSSGWETLFVLVSDLVLALAEDVSGLTVRATSAATGRPVPDAEIWVLRTLTWPLTGTEATGTGRTGLEGTIRFPRPEPSAPPYDPNWITVTGASTHGVARVAYQRSAAVTSVQESRYRFEADRYEATPGETIRWALFPKARTPVDEGDGATVDGSIVVLRGEAARESGMIAVKTGGSGMATGEVHLPPGGDALPVTWKLAVERDSRKTGPASAPLVRPLEIRQRPPRPVDVVFGPEPTLSSFAKVRFSGTVYRDGRPFPSARISWLVSADWAFRSDRRTQDPSGLPARPVLASGGTTARWDGTFVVPWTVPEVPLPGRRYSIEVTVHDESGQAASFVQRSNATRSAVRLEITGRTILRRGETTEITVRRLDAAHRFGMAGESVVTVRQAGGAPAEPLRYRWWDPFSLSDFRGQSGSVRDTTEEVLDRLPEGPEVLSAMIRHDAAGVARFDLPALGPGLYRITVSSPDGSGSEATGCRWMVVDQPGADLPLPFFLLDDANLAGDRRVLVGGNGPAPVAVEVHRVGRPIQASWVAPAGFSILDLSLEESESVLVRASVVDRGQLLTLQKEIGPHALDLGLSLQWKGAKLSVWLTDGSGAPVERALVMAAVWAGEVGEGRLVPGRHRDPVSWQKTSDSGVSPAVALFLRPVSSLEWGSTGTALPELPQERSPLQRELMEFGCGTGAPPPSRPLLPSGRLARGERRPPEEKWPAPATAFWGPPAETDANGSASFAVEFPKGTDLVRLVLTAIAEDGRVGYLSTALTRDSVEKGALARSIQVCP